MIVSFYAALLALLYVGLSVRTLRLRRSLSISIGDGGNIRMLKAMRVHSNFNEYVPLTLILIFFLESARVNAWFIHLASGALLLGRILHAYGVSQTEEKFFFRVSGMAMTLTTIICVSLGLIALKILF